MAKTIANDMDQNVQHPSYYGGEDNPYEAIKVIEAWNLGFHLGNTVKYISRAGKKDKNPMLQDLKKAQFYLGRKIQMLEDEESRLIDVSDTKQPVTITRS